MAVTLVNALLQDGDPPCAAEFRLGVVDDDAFDRIEFDGVRYGLNWGSILQQLTIGSKPGFQFVVVDYLHWQSIIDRQAGRRGRRLSEHHEDRLHPD